MAGAFLISSPNPVFWKQGHADCKSRTERANSAPAQPRPPGNALNSAGQLSTAPSSYLKGFPAQKEVLSILEYKCPVSPSPRGRHRHSLLPGTLSGTDLLWVGSSRGDEYVHPMVSHSQLRDLRKKAGYSTPLATGRDPAARKLGSVHPLHSAGRPVISESAPRYSKVLLESRLRPCVHPPLGA